MAHERGEKRHCAKLTEDKVREIRALYEQLSPNGRRIETQETLGARYGVSSVAIHHVLTRHTWAHVE